MLETFGPDGKWYLNCSGTHYEQALMNGSKELQRLLMRYRLGRRGNLTCICPSKATSK